jgi:hypothetical protein
MSLAARKSDVKQHLSHTTKKHLNPFNSATLPDASITDTNGMAIAGDIAIAKIDLGERPTSAGINTAETVVHGIRLQSSGAVNKL